MHNDVVEAVSISTSYATSCPRSRRAEDKEAREMLDKEPDWWGEGLRQEIEESFRQEVGYVDKHFHRHHKQRTPVT